MKHGRSPQPYSVSAPAAQAALRFAARRNAPNRYSAWRPVALFWRQKRKAPEGLRAGRVGPAARAVWLPQFHLHFVARLNDGLQPDGKRRLSPVMSPVTAIHLRQVVMDDRRTIVQSGLSAPQPGRTQRAWRVLTLNNARIDSSANLQAAASYASSARRPLVAATSTWAADRAQRLKLGQARLNVRSGSSTDAQAQTLRPPGIDKREAYLFRSHPAAVRNVVPFRPQASTATQLYVHPPELAWRRAVPPAAENAGHERQVDLRELVHQPHGRSYPEQEATSGMPQAFGPAPAPPALKIDAGLVDRLADDVIRRVERHARIERERRGL